jgi:YD repeat-containing protein
MFVRKCFLSLVLMICYLTPSSVYGQDISAYLLCEGRSLQGPVARIAQQDGNGPKRIQVYNAQGQMVRQRWQGSDLLRKYFYDSQGRLQGISAYEGGKFVDSTGFRYYPY